MGEGEGAGARRVGGLHAAGDAKGRGRKAARAGGAQGRERQREREGERTVHRAQVGQPPDSPRLPRQPLVVLQLAARHVLRGFVQLQRLLQSTGAAGGQHTVRVGGVRRQRQRALGDRHRHLGLRGEAGQHGVGGARRCLPGRARLGKRPLPLAVAAHAAADGGDVPHAARAGQLRVLRRVCRAARPLAGQRKGRVVQVLAHDGAARVRLSVVGHEAGEAAAARRLLRHVRAVGRRGGRAEEAGEAGEHPRDARPRRRRRRRGGGRPRWLFARAARRRRPMWKALV